jgi:two-component system, NarL family, invasion response regulator UvrY
MRPTAECNILLADDHAIVRRGLQYMLSASIPHAAIVEVDTCEALEKLLAKRDFDLVLLDLVLPDGNTIDRLPALFALRPHLKVLMYSMSVEDVYAERAVLLGAMGFVSKAENEEELLRAVRMVLRGKEYRSERQENRELDRGSAMGSKDPFLQLSKRELSVMDHLLRGHTVGEIAVLLSVGNSTSATYKARLFNKLGVSNLLELQRKADTHGYRIS